MKLTTEPGRVYFVEEIPFQMGPLETKVTIQPVSRKEALNKINNEQCRYTRSNPERLKDDLDEDAVEDEPEEWKK